MLFIVPMGIKRYFDADSQDATQIKRTFQAVFIMQMPVERTFNPLLSDAGQVKRTFQAVFIGQMPVKGTFKALLSDTKSIKKYFDALSIVPMEIKRYFDANSQDIKRFKRNFRGQFIGLSAFWMQKWSILRVFGEGVYSKLEYMEMAFLSKFRHFDNFTSCVDILLIKS